MVCRDVPAEAAAVDERRSGPSLGVGGLLSGRPILRRFVTAGLSSHAIRFSCSKENMVTEKSWSYCLKHVFNSI